MPTLSEEFSESNNPALQERVQMAAVKAGQDISSEAEDTPGHSYRIGLAHSVVQNPTQWRQPFTTSVCAQGVTSQSADADISNTVSAVWNVMAGVIPQA